MAKKNNDNLNVIEVNNVSKSFKVYYDKGYSLKEKVIFWKRNRHEVRQILNNISFSVKKGESIGLIGRNGCGKSTLLKMLTKIYYPNGGSIKINGRVSSLIELGAGFHPDMSGRENIYINASIFGLSRKEIDNRIESIIDFSEIRDFIDNPVRTYSSGMYMRLAFSVAINVDADILLIDEILAVGDANFQAKCYAKMKELKASGITIVLVSHGMQSIVEFCDKCLWIEHGVVKEYGTTEEVSSHYLTYMSDERVMQSLNEQDREALKAELARRARLKEKIIQIDEHHYGTQDAKFTSILVLDKGNKEFNKLKVGDSFSIKMDFELKRNNIKPIVTLSLANVESKSLVYSCDTKNDNVKLNIKNGKCHVEYHCKDLPLRGGKYILRIGLFDSVNRTPLDFYTQYKEFNIVSSEKSEGTFLIKHTWNN